MDQTLTPTLLSLRELSEALEGRPFVATVGSFDGVHLGHQAVIERTICEAKRVGAASVVITFDGHPSAVLHKSAPPLITGTTEKIRYLAPLGADAILLLPFTTELAALSMSDFIGALREIGLQRMVLGYDSRFGCDTSGIPFDLFDKKMAALGAPVERVAPVSPGGVEVSSSRIRELLAEGHIPEAEALLGHPYSLCGYVAEGRQIGRQMGFPTANIVPEGAAPLIPRDAVLAAEVLLDGVTYPAMAYYGTAPTISADDRDYRIEAFLLDFSGDLYGDRVEISFLLYLRGDKRFDSLEELRAQLLEDEEATRDFFRGRGRSV